MRTARTTGASRPWLGGIGGDAGRGAANLSSRSSTSRSRASALDSHRASRSYSPSSSRSRPASSRHCARAMRPVATALASVSSPAFVARVSSWPSVRSTAFTLDRSRPGSRVCRPWSSPAADMATPTKPSCARRVRRGEVPAARAAPSWPSRSAGGSVILPARSLLPGSERFRPPREAHDRHP